MAALASLAYLGSGSIAGAAETYDYSFSFSGTGSAAVGRAAGIAVDNSAGPSAHDVYVADVAEHRIEKFGSSGEFILMFGEGVDGTSRGDVCTATSGDFCKSGVAEPPPGADPAALPWPAFVAVDSSAGPSAGDVYVADEQSQRITKFAPSGVLLTNWGEEGHLTFSERAGGIAVGPNGDLFVQSGREAPATISIYNQSGSFLSSFPISGWSDGTGIAVDGSGDLYFQSEGGIEKFEPPETDLGLIDSEEGAEGVAYDTFDRDLFVKHRGGLIDQFDTGCPLPSCTPLASFGNGYLEANFDWLGIAVDASTHAVFATDYQYSGGDGATVAVFYPPGVVPRATTLPSRSTTETTAEVLGLVDPAGAGTVTGCSFEYVTQANFNRLGGYGESQSSPCVPAPAYSAETQVKAVLSNLEPNTTYHYRLALTNANGSSYGRSETFMTARALPFAETGPVLSSQPTSAQVSATVGPGLGPPASLCSFDYVSAMSYKASGWASAQVAPCEQPPAPYSGPTTVTSGLDNLNPNTTYHYRVIALSSEGQRDGEDRQLTTPGNLPVARPDEPEEKEPEELGPPGHVRCIKHSCAHTFHGSLRSTTWQSPRFPAEYGWQVAVRSHDHWLPHSHLIGGCVATFRGKQLAARINGCHGHIKLRYVGRETFTLFWQLSR